MLVAYEGGTGLPGVVGGDGAGQRRSVQDPDGAVGAAHGEAVAVRTERQAIDPPFDAVQGECFLPRPQVPDLYNQVIPGAGQSLAVGAKRQVGDLMRVGLQGSELFQGLGLDDRYSPVLAPD